MANLNDLLDQFEPKLQKAFFEAIQEITSKAQVNQIIKALERGDIEGAIQAIYLDGAAFYKFEQIISEAYGAGGFTTIQALGKLKDRFGAQFVVRFNPRNPRAELYLSQESSTLITNIINEQREIIRERLRAGMAEGINPRNMALDIVGRIDRATRQRVGGIIGLSAPQEEALRKALQELIEGDYAAYLERKRRDKRFDRTVLKAQREGKPLTQAQISKMINRYADRLLQLRGVTISRTEAHRALNAAQYEALQQLVDTGKVQANQIRRVWDATGDIRTRYSHMAMEGQSVGLSEDFVTPTGKRMRYPGDPKGGAAETINCRCTAKVRIDYFANVK